MLPRVKAWVASNGEAGILYFEDQTGRQTDFNLRAPAPAQPAPGRSKLGVVSREITLLPRHWEWLGRQPNGASAAIRRPVDQARKTPGDRREAAGRIMTALAGNYPGYEEATRALWEGDRERMAVCIREWLADAREYVKRVATCEI